MARATGSARAHGAASAAAMRRSPLFAALTILCATGATVAIGGLWRRPVSPVQVVIDAVGTTRTVAGRLTGGFAFAPLTTPRRGSGHEPEAPWLVLAAAGQLQAAVEMSPTPANLHALGVAALQARRYDEAVLAIEDGLASDDGNGAYHSDLAAAYLERHQHGGPAIDLVRALSAADRAARLAPQLPEAHFNRALALSALHLRHEASLAWDDYLQRFGHDARWRDEAEQRRHEAAREPGLVPPSPALVADGLLDEWAAAALDDPGAAFLPPLTSPDPYYADLSRAIAASADAQRRALAASIIDLRAAEAALARSEYATGAKLADAALARLDTNAPLAFWARRIRLTVAFYAGQAVAGRTEAERLLVALRQRGYRALESDVVLRLAGFEYSRGAYDRALVGYQTAAAIRDALGDRKMGASARLATAEALRALGRWPESWEQYVAVLGVGALGDAALEHVRLVSPIGAADGMPAVALALAAEAAAQAAAVGQLEYGVIADYSAARALARLGDMAGAERRLARAREAFDRGADPTHLSRIRPELDFTEAEVRWATQPARAVAAAHDAARGFGASSTRHRLLALAVLEARAQRAAGNTGAAETALMRGVALVDEQQRLVGRADFVPSFIDASWDVFSELVDLKASQNDAGAALQWLDRGYDLSRRWQAQAGALSWRDVSAAGPVVAYLSRPDALWVWVVRDGGVTQRRVPVTRRALVGRAARIARLLTLDGDGATTALRTEAAALAAEVLWPATAGLDGDDAHRLALVLDPVLQEMPFALLPWAPASPRRVVDVTATVVCPSLAACASLPGPGGVPRARVAALYSSTGDGELAPLPLAREEAERIGRRHAGATVDVASEAAVVAALGRDDLVHFAGHAAPDERYPGRSALVMTDESGDGVRVPLARLFTRHPAAQTVLLSACRTSGAEQRRGHGGTGVAGEFLRAGVRHVVATQWDVRDEPASDVMDLVHEALAAGAQPWDAVRHAQQIVSQDPRRRPLDWAGYVAFTATAVTARGTVSTVSLPPRAERP